MKLFRILTPVALMLCSPVSVYAQSSAFSMPPFIAHEGQLKNSDPPAWQMIAMIQVQSESDINQRGNQLLSSLIGFVKKRGDSASGVVLMITSDERHFDLLNKVIGMIIDEASTRTTPAAIERLKISVSLSDPVSKVNRTLEFRRK